MMPHLEPTNVPGAYLRVSDQRDTLVRRDGRPFFWLGDTAWLINLKLSPAEMESYLDDRAAKGFSVIQVMALHSAEAKNFEDEAALPTPLDRLLTAPSLEGGYWRTMDALFHAAAARGIYVALVPIWGTVLQQDKLSHAQAFAFTRLLALRYRSQPNLIWLNGGDIRGSDHRSTWEALGTLLRSLDPDHPITFHPFGRTRSSTWFHDAAWMDFHMFQSGHRNYDQRTPDSEVAGEDQWFGEDNWQYVLADRALPDAKPTLDGEPSYEDIPHGLHDSLQPRWTAADCRRYAYWSLLAGAFGHTYGHNSIMQFFRRGEAEAHFSAQRDWRHCLDDEGARQMTVVKTFMERWEGRPLRPFDGIPSAKGERYQRQRAALADNALVVYTYCGGTIEVPEAARGKPASWFDPRTGRTQTAVEDHPRHFEAPGPPEAGNDWLLIVDLK